jgi:hypothetical protein
MWMETKNANGQPTGAAALSAIYCACEPSEAKTDSSASLPAGSCGTGCATRRSPNGLLAQEASLETGAECRGDYEDGPNGPELLFRCEQCERRAG